MPLLYRIFKIVFSSDGLLCHMESSGSEIELIYILNGELKFERINMSDRKSEVYRNVSTFILIYR